MNLMESQENNIKDTNEVENSFGDFLFQFDFFYSEIGLISKEKDHILNYIESIKGILKQFDLDN